MISTLFIPFLWSWMIILLGVMERRMNLMMQKNKLFFMLILCLFFYKASQRDDKLWIISSDYMNCTSHFSSFTVNSEFSFIDGLAFDSVISSWYKVILSNWKYVRCLCHFLIFRESLECACVSWYSKISNNEHFMLCHYNVSLLLLEIRQL